MSRAVILGLALAGPTALLLAGLGWNLAHRRWAWAAACAAGLAFIYAACPALAAWEAAMIGRHR